MKKIIALALALIIWASATHGQTTKREFPEDHVTVWSSSPMVHHIDSTDHYIAATFTKTVAVDTAFYSLVYTLVTVPVVYPDPVERICLVIRDLHLHGYFFANRQSIAVSGDVMLIIAYSISNYDLELIVECARNGYILYIEMNEWKSNLVFGFTYDISDLKSLIEFWEAVGDFGPPIKLEKVKKADEEK